MAVDRGGAERHRPSSRRRSAARHRSGAGLPRPAPAPTPVHERRSVRAAGDSAIVINTEALHPAGATSKSTIQFRSLISTRRWSELFEDEQVVRVATGNVVLAQGTNRISAERAEFNTKTRLGTFYNATGIATTPAPAAESGRRDRAAAARRAGNRRLFLRRDRSRRSDPRNTRSRKGGFTHLRCSPTPRWMLTSSTVVLNLDHYTLLRERSH